MFFYVDKCFFRFFIPALCIEMVSTNFDHFLKRNMNIKHAPSADFLLEEKRLDYVISPEMKKVWAVQIDLLQVLFEVCRKHNLRVYAEGGTLLGAIRHKGYIPWDDDIDLTMLREDYDKLMQLGHEFPHPYFLQNVYTDPHYTHRHTQLRNSDTACWAWKEKGCVKRFNQGIFIDIFPSDNMPMNPRAFSRYYKKEGLARQKFRMVSKFINALPEGLYQLLRNKTKMLSDKHRYEAYENVLRSVKHGENGHVCEISFQHNYPILSKQMYGEPQWVDFEYIKLPIPQAPHDILRLQFGENYMTPLRENSVHGNMHFDVEHSYKEHLV